MKHAQVKGKTLKFNVVTEFGDNWKNAIKDRIGRMLAANYYDIGNELSFEDNETHFTVTSPKLTMFFCNSDESDDFIKALDAQSSLSVLTRDDKINRFRLELVGASLTCNYSIPTGGALDGDCEVTFRSGGDYVVSRGDRKTYGSKLKASDFGDSGFSVKAYDGSTLRYCAA